MSAHRVKILHIVSSMGLGGTEKVAQLFATHTPQSTYEVYAYSPTEGPRAEQFRKAGVATFIGGDVLRTVAKVRPDIVHLHRAGWADAQLVRGLARWREKIAPHHSFHIVETNVFGRHDTSPHAAAISTTLFVSHFCANRYETEHGISTVTPRYQVIYNPVDTDFFAAHATAPVNRDFTRPVIGRLSRPDPGKWSALAYAWLPFVCSVFPDVRYRIIGGIKEAQQFIRQHKLEKHVDFLPEVETDEDIATFYNSISVFAHANDTGESFGLAIAEAMACGLPVVTHPAEGLRDNAQLELVTSGETGLIAKNLDEYALALIWLMQNPDKAAEMGKKGQEKAQKLFRAQHVTRQLLDVYEKLMQGTAHVS